MAGKVVAAAVTQIDTDVLLRIHHVIGELPTYMVIVGRYGLLPT